MARCLAVAMSQAPGLVGDARLRPLLERGDQGVLRQLLGQADVAHHAGQAGDEPGRLDAPDRLDGAMGIGSRHGHRSHHHRSAGATLQGISSHGLTAANASCLARVRSAVKPWPAPAGSTSVRRSMIASSFALCRSHSSPWKLLGLGVLGVLVTAVLRPPFKPDRSPSWRARGAQELAGHWGPLLGRCSRSRLAAVGRREPGHHNQPDGFRVTLFRGRVIPGLMQDIATWGLQGEKAMVFVVDPAVESRRATAAIARGPWRQPEPSSVDAYASAAWA